MGEITYRFAGTADLPRLVGLAQDMWQESPEYKDVQFSPDHMAESFINRIVAAKGAVITAIYAGEIIGFITGHVSEYGFSPETIAAEDGWYVKPEHRKGRIGVKLVQLFETWGESVGARETKIAPSAGIGSGRLYTLLEKLNYREAGRIFKK